MGDGTLAIVGGMAVTVGGGDVNCCICCVGVAALISSSSLAFMIATWNSSHGAFGPTWVPLSVKYL